MQLNLMGYQFRDFDGYGRFGGRLYQALQRQGCDVVPMVTEQAIAPAEIQRDWGLDWSRLTVAILPAYYGLRLPGRQWMWTMTEGSELPDGWANKIMRCLPERMITPCEWNAEALRRATHDIGYDLPVHVIPGGTDPVEFDDVRHWRSEGQRDTYTFLAMGDRGSRKGWTEVWAAFYQAFGPARQTPDVRLLIKSRPKANEMLDLIAEGDCADPRIEIWRDDVSEMQVVYAAADCVVMPSRSEGWGMPHREAAMMGLPVITQAYSGMDDGHTAEWSIPVQHGQLEAIPGKYSHIKGEWRKADIGELATTMRYCYENRREVAYGGAAARKWLSAHQTWDHSAAALVDLIKEHS